MSGVAGVGRIVHYVAHGPADGVSPAVCRAAVVTETEGRSLAVGLAVLNPMEMLFHSLAAGGVQFHGGDPGEGLGAAAGARCAGGYRVYPGDTWHWPEFT